MRRSSTVNALIAFAIASLCAACSSADGETPLPEPDGGSIDAPVDAPPIDFGDVAVLDSGDSGVCEPPDFLVVLDRSNSMGASAGPAPDGGKLPSKWTIASGALGDLVAGPTDTTLRFGLEVFPDVGGACANGTMLVKPGIATGAAIKSSLSSITLLPGTPLGAPLDLARKHLASTKAPGRKQFVLLVTDGGETCSTAKALPVVQDLAKDGVKTYVVGFGAAVNVKELNDLACAGLTAPSHKTSCVSTTTGFEWNGTSTNLFFQAQDGASLKKALNAVAGTTCCGCTVN